MSTMDILVEIKTPPNEAINISNRLKNHMLPRRVKYKSYTNDANDTLYWEVTGSVRDIMKVIRNVNAYDVIMFNAFESKMVQSQVKKRLSQNDQDALREMLISQTTLKIIKQSEKEKEESGMTWWDKVRTKFSPI